MEVKTLAVIGAGTMGQGIAQVAAMGGYDVYLVDVEENILRNAVTEIQKNLRKGGGTGEGITGTAEGFPGTH
jgi:3-hydroxyacyl-CoA dehydrogenase